MLKKETQQKVRKVKRLSILSLFLSIVSTILLSIGIGFSLGEKKILLINIGFILLALIIKYISKQIGKQIRWINKELDEITILLDKKNKRKKRTV
jgi:hypothetical protein